MNVNVSNLAGGDGGNYIADTTVTTGDWSAIYAITDATFTTLTSGNVTGTLTGITLSKGMTLNGQFSAITLAGGSVIAYKRV